MEGQDCQNNRIIKLRAIFLLILVIVARVGAQTPALHIADSLYALGELY